jgi:glutamate dehydrogenase
MISEAAMEVISEFTKSRLEKRASDLIEAGTPDDLARKIADLPFLGGAFNLIEAANRLDRDLTDLAGNFFSAGAHFGIDWIWLTARELEPVNHWERIALSRLLADLRSKQSAIGAAAIVQSHKEPGADSIAEWERRNAEAAARTHKLIDGLRDDGSLNVAKHALVSSQLQSLRGV